MICGFETALRSEDHSSPWCDLISKEESKVLEYTFDLKVFIKRLQICLPFTLLYRLDKNHLYHIFFIDSHFVTGSNL